MHKRRVGVMRGGPSSEYDVSLKSGASVLKNLSAEKYIPIDIFIDREGTWHMGGAPVSEENLHGNVDVIFNALHGEYGEDGTLAQILDTLSIPYTGSGALASALGFHKKKAKDIFSREGLTTPPSVVIDVSVHTHDDLRDIFRTLPHPSVVKPITAGSSVGVSEVHAYDELFYAVARAAEVSPHVLVESLVSGREATVAIIEDFRGEELYAFPPVEIISSEEICPGRFSREETEMLRDAARRAHKALGASHYSQSDFIVTPRGVHIIEIHTLPELSEESLLPKSLHAVGATLSDFLDHVVSLALK